MRIRRPAVAVWALLVVGGWGTTLWLDEPTATAGPGAGRAPDSTANPDPGPQPEGGPCDRSPRTGRSASPWPASSPSSVPDFGSEARRTTEEPQATDRLYICAVAR